MSETSINETIKQRNRWLPTPAALIGVWLIFFVIVIFQLTLPTMVGFQTNHVQFAGAFGHAFGVLSSLMATIAALGAWETVRQQRIEASERARESQKTVFNEKFFSLLSHLNGLVDGTDIDVRKNNERVVREGRDAFRSMLTTLRKKIPPGAEPVSLAKIQKRYLEFYNEKENDLDHYFRTIYVISKMIVDEQDHIDKKSYLEFYVHNCQIMKCCFFYIIALWVIAGKRSYLLLMITLFFKIYDFRAPAISGKRLFPSHSLDHEPSLAILVTMPLLIAEALPVERTFTNSRSVTLIWDDRV